MRILKKITLQGEPLIKVRPVLFTDKKKDIKDKQNKPFVSIKPLSLVCEFWNDKDTISVCIPSHYTYDGATIPFGLGKGDMKLLIPALFHDMLCDNKYIIYNDRFLSTQIFCKCLLQCKNNILKTLIMGYVVDIFQMLCGHWRTKVE